MVSGSFVSYYSESLFTIIGKYCPSNSLKTIKLALIRHSSLVHDEKSAVAKYFNILFIVV